MRFEISFFRCPLGKFAEAAGFAFNRGRRKACFCKRFNVVVYVVRQELHSSVCHRETEGRGDLCSIQCKNCVTSLV